MDKKYSDVVNTNSSRSWFCVLNNPQKIFGEDKTPEEIVQEAIRRWIEKKPMRSCAINYEIADTGTPHLHMVLEDPAKTRFSALKKLYGNPIHIERTRGNKKQAMDYILKNPPFEEKGHTVVVPAVIVGDIKAAEPKGKVNIYEEIDMYVKEGLTPKQIMNLSSRYRKEEALIRKTYFSKREAETPPKREVKVIWHVGKSGTGKSYTFVNLCEQLGEESIYMLSDHKSGGLDMYCGEPILFIDELREFTYSVLLGILEGLKKQVHCRYANVVGLWNEVHITSVYAPEELYKLIVPDDQRKRDSLQQLTRRITTVIYHYIENGEYKSFSLDGSSYENYEDLIDRATNPDYNNFHLQTKDEKDSNPFS